MSVSQRDAYEGDERIDSDPFGLVDRDNRNHAKKRQRISERSAAEAGDRVLEVGCGGGLHARAWADTYDLTAVDLSGSLCRQTRGRAPDASVVQADATSLPFPDGHFDAVVGNAVLHHFADAAAALREWARVATDSITLAEPNYLFPKDWLETHTIPEEQHKTQMAPWRLRKTLASISDTWALEPFLATPPWPTRAASLFDRIDDLFASVPGLRWCAQMQLVHLEIA